MSFYMTDYHTDVTLTLDFWNRKMKNDSEETITLLFEDYLN